jgi:hypothetical protein
MNPSLDHQAFSLLCLEIHFISEDVESTIDTKKEAMIPIRYMAHDITTVKVYL